MNTDPYTRYHLYDNQKELLYKIQDYLIETNWIEKIRWTKGNPPVEYTVFHPVEKIVRMLNDGYYYEYDKNELNGLREFYILCIKK